MIVKVFVADGLLWGTVAGGILGDRAEFIPVEGKAFEFKVDSPEQGLFDWEFIADEQGTPASSRVFLPSVNIRAEGFKKH